MPRKSSRRLAGCIAIELLILAAVSLQPANGEPRAGYQAGTATVGQVKVLALEERRGSRAVFAEADFEITQAVSDFVAARLLQSYELERPSLLLRGVGVQPAQPEDLITAIGAAMGRLEPVLLRYNGSIVSVASSGNCMATLAANASLAFDHCATGASIGGPIRAAFQMASPTRRLLQRSDPLRAYPVQAIALGRQVVVVALGGDSRLQGSFRPIGLLFASHANDSVAPPDDPRIREAIGQVLSRVGR